MNALFENILNDKEKHKDARARGRLTVFFGVHPCSGKRSAMLERALSDMQSGADVCVGALNNLHFFAEKGLIGGLEILPPRSDGEFDLDAMLSRSPEIAIVDSLERVNAKNNRHLTRLADIKELLQHGISVYTTLDVQNLEGGASMVEKFFGIKVKEQIPDETLDYADEIFFSDFSSNKIPDGNPIGADGFNLLREMALRFVCNHANVKGIHVFADGRKTPSVSERLILGLGLGDNHEVLIRRAKRYVSAINADWIVVHICEPGPYSPDDYTKLGRALEFARSMGAKIIVSNAYSVPEGLSFVAKNNDATIIMVGRSAKRSWFCLRPSVAEKLMKKTASTPVVAVTVVPMEKNNRLPKNFFKKTFGQYAFVICVVSLITLLLLALMDPRDFFLSTYEDWLTALTLPFAIIISGVFLRVGPVILMSLLSSLSWVFFVTYPYYSFHMEHPKDIFLLFSLFFVAAVTSVSINRLRAHSDSHKEREQRILRLYNFLGALSGGEGFEDAMVGALSSLEKMSDAKYAIYIPQGLNFKKAFVSPSLPAVFSEAKELVDWTLENAQSSGRETETFRESEFHCIPLFSGKILCGALCIKSSLGIVYYDIRPICDLLGDYIAKEAMRKKAEIKKDLERSHKLQKTLLDTVSHELKTPLSIISSALEQGEGMIKSGRTEHISEVLKTAGDSSKRLIRNVNMLLDMTRFDSNVIKPQIQICYLSDIFESLSLELCDTYPEYSFKVEGAEDICVQSDEILLYQLFNQLLRNSFEHSGTKDAVKISVVKFDGKVLVEIADSGRGISESAMQKLFDPFFKEEYFSRGLGLGLSICKRICELLYLEISVRKTVPHGTTFTIKLKDNCEKNTDNR